MEDEVELSKGGEEFLGSLLNFFFVIRFKGVRTEYCALTTASS